MEEAERLCDRVAIIDRGQVISLGTPDELIAGLGGDHVIEFSLLPGEAELPQAARWNDLPSVSHCRRENGRFRLSAAQPHVVLPALLQALEQGGWQLAGLTTRHASLDDVFIKVAGRSIEAAEKNDE